MAMITFGAADDLVPERGKEAGIPFPEGLPGLTLSKLTITKLKEPFWQKKSEVYLVGVAADASGTVRVIPFGQAELDKKSDTYIVRKMGKGDSAEFLGEGLALVLPPVSGFLVMRLLVVDSDSKARDLAPVLKAAGDIAGNEKVIAALVATGLPHAAAVAAVLGKSIEAVSLALEKNRDDVISLFEGYFTSKNMVPGTTTRAKGDGASAEFTWV